MVPSLRVVDRLPVEVIWDEEGEVDASRERMLSMEDLSEMLRNYPVEFYIADVGHRFKRVEIPKCYEFWKSEVKAHLVSDPNTRINPESFPGQYCYIASEWSGRIQSPIVLLEKQH
jgi:hypothetical protein